MKAFGKKIAAVACAAAMAVSVGSVAASAATINFKFTMGPFQSEAFNQTGLVSKDYDGDKNFYAAPTEGLNTSWDEPHFYAINERHQECNRDTTRNRLNGYYTHKIPYYAQSVPVGGQRMDCKIKEFKAGIHNYTLTGRWTP